MTIAKRIARPLGALFSVLLAVSGAALAQAPQPPIRIGSTLALTGPLETTSHVHKVVGEI
jgi:branched-chain amino acid transport system substrate-binding protein